MTQAELIEELERLEEQLRRSARWWDDPFDHHGFSPQFASGTANGLSSAAGQLAALLERIKTATEDALATMPKGIGSLPDELLTPEERRLLGRKI